MRCARLGDPLRNSDPQIASAVNVAAGRATRSRSQDPPGLHLGPPLTAGMITPDGADAASFWKIERGNRAHLRARFEVPPARGYVVGDIGWGRAVEFGGQIAHRVQVWVKVLVRAGRPHADPGPVRLVNHGRDATARPTG